jgi:hypothetical protein
MDTELLEASGPEDAEQDQMVDEAAPDQDSTPKVTKAAEAVEQMDSTPSCVEAATAGEKGAAEAGLRMHQLSYFYASELYVQYLQIK